MGVVEERRHTSVVLPIHNTACGSKLFSSAANHSTYLNFSLAVADHSAACGGFCGFVIGDGGFYGDFCNILCGDFAACFVVVLEVVVMQVMVVCWVMTTG